jgi:soluble lytic murein transglycosylase-like protein
MILSGMFIFAATMVASIGNDNIAKPALSIPKPAAVSATYRAAQEKRERELELAKLKAIVNSLGGKPEHAKIIQSAGREFKIDPVFLAAVTFVESSFRPDAASNKGARGLMQLKPIVLNVFGVTDPWDPHDNVMAGAAYLKHCFERYAKQPNSTYLVLAAYNIGPGPPEKLNNSEAAERFVKKVLLVYNRFTDIPIPVSKNDKNDKKDARKKDDKPS